MSRRWLLAAAVAALAMVPHLGGLRNGFAFDDVAIAAENPRIRSMAGLRDVLTTDWWNGTTSRTLVYRPLAMLTFAPDYALARIGATEAAPAHLPDRLAFPFHLQNLIWHAAASIALFVLVLEMFSCGGLAFTTAALFAVHPVHTEAVYGIVGRAELISAFFIFVSLTIAWRCLRDDPEGAGRPALAGLFLLLAALSKEYAIVVPAVPLIWIYLRPKAERRAIVQRRSFRWLMASLVAAAAGYLVLRSVMLRSITGVAAAPGNLHDPNNPIATASGAARWLTPVRVFGDVLRLLFYPKTLSVDYSFAQIPVVRSPDVATMLCLAALIGLLVAAVLLRERAKATSFGISFFFLAWALTANFVIPIGTILGERLLYLPSAGACLAVASGLAAAGRRFRRTSMVLTTLLVAVGAARTFARGPDWKDDLTLFERAAEATPRSCKVRYNLAIDLKLAGRSSEAIDQYRRALELGPNDAKIHNNLAGLLLEEGKLGEAIEHAEQAVRIDPADTDSNFNLGRLLIKAGRVDEAVEHLGSVVRAKPGDAEAQHAYGFALEKQGRRNEAIVSYQRALAIDPELAEAHNDLGVALARDNRIPEALEQFREAVAINPDFEAARNNQRQAENVLRGRP